MLADCEKNNIKLVSGGKCGDWIAACSWIKQQHPGAQLCLVTNKHFNIDSANWIKPLLQAQSYVGKVTVIQNPEELKKYPTDITKARKLALSQGVYSLQWVYNNRDWQPIIGCSRQNLDLRDRFAAMASQPKAGTEEAWLQLPECTCNFSRPYIILSITPRYRCFTDLSLISSLSQYYNIFFLGDKRDWILLGANKYSSFLSKTTAIQQAQIIKNSSLCVSTQTLQIWLAQSLGVNRILSASSKTHDTTLRVDRGFKAVVKDKKQLQGAIQQWKIQVSS